MNATKISDSEIEEIKVSSLPTRPTAPTAFGGKGYTAREIKEAFDKLPLLLIERYNTLIDDIEAPSEESIAAAINTGLDDGHKLSDLFEDITNGNMASYLTVGGNTLYSCISRLMTAVFGEDL